jgi:hypothetical protein
LTLESIDNIQRSDSLSLGMFSVGDSITDHVFQEDFEDTTGFFVDETRDTLDTTTTSETTNSRLGNTLNVVTKNLTMTLQERKENPNEFMDFCISTSIVALFLPWHHPCPNLYHLYRDQPLYMICLLKEKKGRSIKK